MQLVLKLLELLEVVIAAGAANTTFERRGEKLRRPLTRKKVHGCARAAMRSNEVDDIGKEICCVPFLELFVELFNPGR